MTEKKQKYVLFKNDGSGPKPCAFFASAEGCKNGVFLALLCTTAPYI